MVDGEELVSEAVEQTPDIDNSTGEREPEVEFINFDDIEAKYRRDRDLETEQRKCRKLIFRRGGKEIMDLTGYNTTHPILDKQYDSDSGKPYFVLRARMEERTDQKNSKVVAFRSNSAFSTEWDQVEDEEEELPVIIGQDPSVAELGDELFLSVIEVESVPDDSQAGSHLKWWPRFFKGPDIRHLVPFGRGPDWMKNVTPVKMPTLKIITFTRPQRPGNEALGGLGQIGEVTTDTIEEIVDPTNPDILQKAEHINTRFKPGEEWGGIKYGKPLMNNCIGVIGHISRFDKESPLYNEDVDEKPKIYATFAGIYDPRTRKINNIEIVAMYDEFVGVVPKNEYLEKIVYTTGMTEPDEDGKVMIIQGVGDAETWSKVIDDPFAGLRLPAAEQSLIVAT